MKAADKISYHAPLLLSGAGEWAQGGFFRSDCYFHVF